MSDFERGKNQVTFYLSPNQRGIIPVPVELQRIIPDTLWNERVQAATQVASRYSKPLFERIWLTLALLSIVIVPIVLVPVIAKAIHEGQDPDTLGAHYAVARGIGIGIFAGTALLFFIPVFVWKLIGRMQVRRLLQHWIVEDRVMLDQTQFIPKWAVKPSSVFRDSIALSITTPPPMGATLYNPAAYMPSHITAPTPPDPAFTTARPFHSQAVLRLISSWLSPIRHCACVYYQDWHRTKRPRVAVEGGILPGVSQVIAPAKSMDASPAVPGSTISSPRNTLSSTSGVVVAVGDSAEPQGNALLQTNAPPASSSVAPTGLPFDEEAKLVYGVILSLRNMVKKLSGRCASVYFSLFGAVDRKLD
ncbi:TRAPP subunit bet5 [Pleurotus pulmonarius]|nr:TRAPP subunit bet5 [Pleurotus pulmonarius]